MPGSRRSISIASDVGSRPPDLDRNVQVGDTRAEETAIAEIDEGDLRRAKAGAQARVAQLEARVATARDNLDIATRNFERFAKSSGSVSEAARDGADAKRVAAAGEPAAAKHALADARVQLDQANDSYLNRRVIAPFDNATVVEMRIEPGERKAAPEARTTGGFCFCRWGAIHCGRTSGRTRGL